MLKLPGLQGASPVWPEAATAILPGQAAGGLGMGTWATVLAWSVLRHLHAGKDPELMFDELQLRSALAEIFSGLGVMGDDAWRAAARVRVLLRYGRDMETGMPGETEEFWKDGDVRWLTSVNESGGVAYLNKEAFDELLWWMEIAALVRAAETEPVKTGAAAEVKRRMAAASAVAAEAGYEVNRYVSIAGKEKEVEPAGKPANNGLSRDGAKRPADGVDAVSAGDAVSAVATAEAAKGGAAKGGAAKAGERAPSGKKAAPARRKGPKKGE